MRASRLRYSIWLAALVSLGCSDGETGPGDTAVAAFGGNGQSGAPGQPLGNAIAVRVTRGGMGLSGLSVTWTVTGGGGNVDPVTSVSGADGLAFTLWTLGPNPGANTLQATVMGAAGSPVEFTATGTGPVATH